MNGFETSQAPTLALSPPGSSSNAEGDNRRRSFDFGAVTQRSGPHRGGSDVTNSRLRTPCVNRASQKRATRPRTSTFDPATCPPTTREWRGYSGELQRVTNVSRICGERSRRLSQSAWVYGGDDMAEPQFSPKISPVCSSHCHPPDRGYDRSISSTYCRMQAKCSMLLTLSNHKGCENMENRLSRFHGCGRVVQSGGAITRHVHSPLPAAPTCPSDWVLGLEARPAPSLPPTGVAGSRLRSLGIG